MVVTDVASGPDTATRPRMWLLAAAVVGVVLVVSAVMAATHLRTASAEPSQTITVGGREYRAPVEVAGSTALSGPGTWTQVGTVPAGGAPVYAVQITGAAPTAVFVPSSGGEYTEYTLVGGP